jgi:hypothetical protein
MKLSYLHNLQLQARANRACGMIFQGPPEQDLEPTPIFVVDGTSYTLAEMLDANKDDADLCAWLLNARAGDRFPAPLDCRRAA